MRICTFLFHQVKFPSSISKNAKDLLAGLLRKNPRERLGGGPNDVKDIMSHAFFSDINWTDLVQRKVSLRCSLS